MKKTLKAILILTIAAGAVAGLIFAYSEMSQDRAKEAEREKPVMAKSRVNPGSNGEPVLTLDEETQKRVALKVEPVASAQLRPELKGYGRILDPAPLAALVADLSSAQAAWAASQKEFDRLKLLNEQKNSSDRALQAAEATARRDQIQLQSLHARLELAWGKAVADQPDLPALIETLASLQSAIARIDLPAGDVVKSPPASARIALATAGASTVHAQLLGPVPVADPQTQGQGFLFLVKADSLRLAAGMALEGYLQFQAEPLYGVTIPDSAVVRHAGEGWVYLQTGDDTFARRKISLDHPTEKGWFIQHGVAPKERVVVSGAQTLLSEEQKNQFRLLE